MDSAASTAPPPGTTDFDSRTRFTTHRASWTERSISSHMKSLAPRSTRLAAVRTLGLYCHIHTETMINRNIVNIMSAYTKLALQKVLQKLTITSNLWFDLNRHLIQCSLGRLHPEWDPDPFSRFCKNQARDKTHHARGISVATCHRKTYTFTRDNRS